jgi:hypothetical protein
MIRGARHRAVLSCEHVLPAPLFGSKLDGFFLVVSFTMAGTREVAQRLVDAYWAELGVLWRLGGAATREPSGPAALQLADQKTSLDRRVGALARKLRMQVDGAKELIPLMTTPPPPLPASADELSGGDEDATWEPQHKRPRPSDSGPGTPRLPRDWQEVHSQTSAGMTTESLEWAAQACVARATTLATLRATGRGAGEEQALAHLLSACAAVQAHWKRMRLLSSSPWLSLGRRPVRRVCRR